MKNKRLCVLQITPEFPNPKHVKEFLNKEKSDFYFVTFKNKNPDSLEFCPNTIWSETRNTLAEKVPKVYDYYAFMDYDVELETMKNPSIYEQMLEDLEMNPAVLTYYPGQGLQTPYANDKEYFQSREYSCIPFTHNGVKIVHKSLLEWFFPMFTKFRVDIDSCHMFNIQEIPFLKNVICSHNMIYHNTPTESASEQVYNKNGAFSKSKMDEMWNWIKPSFKKNSFLENFMTNDYQKNDSLFIKEVFLSLFHNRVHPNKEQEYINYYDLEKISKFFDLEHEFFKNKNKGDLNGR